MADSREPSTASETPATGQARQTCAPRGLARARDSARPICVRRLRGGAAGSWVGAGALLVTLWGHYWFGVLPIGVIPVLIVLAITLVAIFWTIGAGTWFLLRGSNRLQALRWMVLALIVPLLIATPCLYAGWSWSKKQVPGNALMRTGTMLAAFAMHGEALCRYRNRVETKRLVMLYDQLEHPQQDADELERHVARLESMLGRQLPRKIVWIRGSALGEDFLSIHGIALGSSDDVRKERARYRLCRLGTAQCTL